MPPFVFSHLKNKPLGVALLFAQWVSEVRVTKMATDNLCAFYKPEFWRHTLPWWPLSQRVHLATSTGDCAAQL